MSQRPPTDKPEQFQVEPLRLLPPVAKKRGRPAKNPLPPLDFAFNEVERDRYTRIIDAVRAEAGNLTPFDEMLLELVGVEYVKYLRLAQYEVQKNTSITMARQHPGVQMRALIDMLSISRKARQTGKQEKDPEREAALQMLKGLAG